MSLNTILATAPLTATGYHLKATGTALGQSLIWDNGTNVGIGNTNTTYTFDVTGTGNFSSGALTLTLGADNGATTRTNVTQKIAKIVSYNYTNANNPVGMMVANNDGTDNALWIGGGSGATIAATNIQFFTAANNNTATGTARLTISSTGAATFSSSVTATTGTLSTTYNGGGIGMLHLTSDGTEGGTITFQKTSGTAQKYKFGLSTTSLFIYNETAGNQPFTITSGGNVLIGTTTDYGYKTTISGTNSLYLRATDSTSAANTIALQNSNGITTFSVRNDGLFITGTEVNSPYNNTTTSLANGFIGSIGQFARSTASSLRYKENINDWNESGLDTILALKPKTFTYKADYYKNPDVVMLGLIAEEVAEVSPYLADYENEDRTGQVENVRYATIVVPLIKSVQEQQALITSLQAQINAIVATK